MTASNDASVGLNWLTLIAGPFIGASLAFLSARILDSSRRQRERLAAANLALLTLKNQYNDFLLFRKGFREDVARPGLMGDEPLWALLRPTFITFANYDFDFKSIGFLFEQPGYAEAFENIDLVQMYHRDLIALEELRTENAMALQATLVMFQKISPNATWIQMEAEVGRNVTELMTMVAIGLAIRADRNEDVYLTAFRSLRYALECELKKHWYATLRHWCAQIKNWFDFNDGDAKSVLINIKEPQPSFSLASLPPMPPALAKAVAISVAKPSV